MSEKMRESFELWAMDGGCIDLRIGDDGLYMDNEAYYAFEAWKASRAALVVELPCERLGELYADGYNAALQDVENALTEVGVNYK